MSIRSEAGHAPARRQVSGDRCDLASSGGRVAVGRSANRAQTLATLARRNAAPGRSRSVLRRGSVALVGAGPGDPELLTLKALLLLQQAEVVVFDNLVSREILDLIPPQAGRVFVGKESGNHTLPQEKINEVLLALARSGKKVLRLKGGDPYVFGRGGEEMLYLAKRGVPVQVVPGVTSANGASCNAGIPLTHRDYSQACVFATGHLKNGKLDLDWEMLARPGQTVVIYMGLGQLAAICARLIEHGLPIATPAAIVERATTSRERVVTGTIDTIADHCARAGMRPPGLIIVGEVVRVRAAAHRAMRSGNAQCAVHPLAWA